MANTNNANTSGMSAGGQGEQAAHSREIKDVQKEIKSGAGAGKKGVFGKIPPARPAPKGGRRGK